MLGSPLILSERRRDIGGFAVGRLLPTRNRRMVGPFIFIDHMGPEIIGPDSYLDVDQHPHIGLSTLTYLMEGEINHKDSLGSVRRITPGSVNWMVAGSGVTHTERTPDDMRNGNRYRIHGYQIWVALPKDIEDMSPEFHHSDASELPVWTEKDVELKLIAGEGFGRRSPVPVQSHLFMIEAKSKEERMLDIKGSLTGEIGICVVDGHMQSNNQRIDKGHMLISGSDQLEAVTLGSRSHILLLGGESFPEKRYIHWNFVSSSVETIRAAEERWKLKQFPKVPEDDSYVEVK